MHSTINLLFLTKYNKRADIKERRRWHIGIKNPPAIAIASGRYDCFLKKEKNLKPYLQANRKE